MVDPSAGCEFNGTAGDMRGPAGLFLPRPPRSTRAAGTGGRRASDFGRMNFIEKFTALLDYIEYAGLNYFGTESD
jgi:hypothetical protein